MPSKLRRVVLDVLKPHDPNIVELSQKLAVLPGVSGVNITIYEVDRQVENAKITMEGDDLNYGLILEHILDAGGTVHSIDEVAAGKIMIEESHTPQDATTFG